MQVQPHAGHTGARGEPGRAVRKLSRSVADDRLRALEAQIAGLREEMATLVRGAGAGGGGAFAPAMAMAMTPDDDEDHEHIVRVVHAEAVAGSEEDDEEAVPPARGEVVGQHASPSYKRRRTASPSPPARLPAAPNTAPTETSLADPVSAGYCTESEARRLYDRYVGPTNPLTRSQGS